MNINVYCHASKIMLDAVQQHVGMAEHVCLATAEAQNQTKITAGIQLADTKRRAAAITAMKTAYLEELPNCKYKAVLSFLQHLNVGSACYLLYLRQSGNASYDSPTIFNVILDCSSAISKNELKIKLNSNFIGIGIDESTDRSQEKHVALVVRFVNSDGEVETVFLVCTGIKDETADSLVKVVQKSLRSSTFPSVKLWA